MSTEAFRLVGIVEARTRGAENDLRRVDRVAQSTARSFQQAFGSGNTINVERMFFSAGKAADGFLARFSHISNIIQGIPQIGQLAGALTRPLFQAAEEGIRLNMTLEQAQIGYEQVAGSAEKASKFLNELTQFAVRSPFRFEGLLEASRLMTAMGFSLSEQIPKLRIWGNAIAASGEISAESIHRVVVAMGQIRMAGRVNAQDMMQLTNANLPGWELLAKAIGKTVAETRKLGEAGRLNGPKAVEAMTAMMSIDPRFQNMMDRLQNTTAGRMSAAQDIIQFAQAKSTKQLTGNINNVLGEALKKEDLVNSLAGSFDAVLGPVSGVLSAAAKDLLGGGITGGIKEGIAAGREVVSLEAASLGQSIIDSFKSILGINSPSKVFIEFGHDVADGFNLGFADGMKNGAFGSVIDKFLSGVKNKTEREKIERAISENSARTGIPAELLRALIQQESRGQYNAMSPKGARGVMQLMPETARDQGLRVNGKVDERLDVEKSIRAGADYLKEQLDRFNGDFRLALAAYNAGPGAVTKYGNQVPPYTETRNYVRTIMEDWARSVVGQATQQAGGSAPQPKTLQQQVQDLQRVYQQLTPAERTKLDQLGSTIRKTMDRIADIDAQLRAAQAELDRSRPSANGGKFDPNREYKAAIQVDSLNDQQKRLLDALSQLRFENERMVQALISRYASDGKNVGGDVVIGAGILRKAAQSTEPTEPAATRLRTVSKDIQKTAETLPVTGQAAQQIAENTERAVKGAGQWKDVVVESEEAIKRLKVQWNGLAQGFETAFLNATGQAIQGHFGDAIKGFFLDLSFDWAQQVNSAFAARLSKTLFDFQGSDSEASGGLVNKFLNKVGLGSILEKIGLQKPRAMSFDEMFSKMRNAPVSTGNVMATSLSGASGSATESALKGSMPSSKGAPKQEAGNGDRETQQTIRNSTDKIVSGQQAQTAQINTQIMNSADRIVDGLTPRQQGFLRGLLGAVLSGAASGAASASFGGLLSGNGSTQRPDEGPTQPRPTTPPTMKFPNGRTTPRALGGDLVSGQAYLFGERGPEIGVFPANGRMLPNNHPATQLALGKSSGAVINNHYHFNVHAHGSDAAMSIKKSRRQLERQAAQTLGFAARQAMAA